MTHPAGGPGPAAQSARERASRSFLILAPAALVGSGEDLSRTSLLHCFHQSLSSSMASQWTLSGEMTLKVQAILWQGDEAHRPWSQDAWAQISSFLSDIKASNSPDGSHSVSLGPGMRTTQTVPNQLKGSSLPYGVSGGFTLATPYTPHNRSCSLLYTARRWLELEPNLCGQMRKSRPREAEGLTHSHTAEVTEPELGGWLLSLCS
ncbi:uncharacterized protein [Globicephala melas]|uniref:uncharacterized protein isoform X9 n=1 Tax=Globicephala melas TaxID=9731 RepID=UPI003872C46F